MIAPVKSPQTAPSARRRGSPGAWRRIIRTLLETQPRDGSPAAPATAWRAWALAIWAVTVTTAYLAAMCGWRP